MAPHRPQDAEARRAQSTSWSAVNYLLRSGFSWSGHERNNLFVNLGDGSFGDVSHVAGIDFADDARGVAVVDWDADGDLDLWLNNRSSPKARLLRNELTAGRRWLSLRLVGTSVNRDAVGARVELTLASGRTLIRTVRAGVNYTAQGSKKLHFGLGGESRISGLSVRWPDGSSGEYGVPAVDRLYRLTQGDPLLEPVDPPVAASRLEAGDLTVEQHPRAASVPLGAPLEVPLDLGMTDFDGRRHVLAGYRGAPLLINVWASWCGPCRSEFADFAAHRSTLAASGLTILACSVDEDPDAAVVASRELGPGFATGMCDDRFLGLLETVKKVVLDRYDDLLLPTSLLLDRDGRLARLYIGPANAVQLAEDVRALEAAESELEVLRLAAVEKGGRWERPEVWLATQRGRQLLQMTRFLTQENRDGELSYYAAALGRYLNESDPPERTLATATTALLAAARSTALDDPAKAVSIYRAVLRHRTDDPDVYLNLSWALLEAGREVEAARAVERALALAPEAATAREASFRGLILRRLGEPARAVPEFERALEIDPEDATSSAALVAARTEAERLEGAITALAAEAAAAPEDSDLVLSLAMALEKVGRAREARSQYERFLELSPSPTSVAQRARLGHAYYRLGRWQEAATELAAVADLEPDRLEDRRMLGLALARSGHDAEARAELEAVGFSDPETLYVLGLVRARTGDLAAAVTSFEAVLELEPDSAEALRSLALARDRLGQPELAISLLGSYLRAVPDDFATRGRLGAVLERAGREVEAIAAYRRVIEGDPARSETKFRLAWLLATSATARNRSGSEALRLARELRADNAAHPALLDLLAAAHAETGRFDEAVRLAGEASALAAATGDDAMAEQIRARLELYRNRQAFYAPS